MSTENRGPRHPSPSLAIVAIVYAFLFVGSIALTTALAGGAHYPNPLGPREDAMRFFAENASAVRLGAFLQLGATIPLAIFAATTVSRLRFFGVQAAGTTIALVGGLGAPILGAVSALVSWVLAQPGAVEGASGGGAHLWHLFAFATGGVGHVAFLGLFVAGVAVTGGLHRLLPRWLMATGLGIAIAAELSTLTLVTESAVYLLPIARFTALLWMIAVGLRLPKARARGASSSERSAAPPTAALVGGVA